MKFVKMQACGNDYLLIDGRTDKITCQREYISKMCNRRFGVGADGVVVIGRSDVADVSMKMYNADGTEGLICGNALRCVGKYVFDQGIVKHKKMTVFTASGIKIVKYGLNTGKVGVVEGNLGRAVTIVSTSTDYNGERCEYTLLNVGNDHCVVLVPDVQSVDILELGRSVQAEYPTANVEVCSLKDGRAYARVYERGSGETYACGSGACAIAWVLKSKGLIKSSVKVVYPGGEIGVRIVRNDLILSSDCTLVYEGNYD